MSTSELPVPSRPPGERPDFETLITTLSSRLLAALPEDMDAAVLAGLEDIRLLFGADRCGFMTVSADGRVVQVGHASCSQGVEPVSPDTDLGRMSPWSRRKLVEEGVPARIDRLDDLPPQAAVDRAGYAGMSVRSSLAVPISIGRRVARLIAVQTVNEELAWSAGHVARLRLLGEMLVNALERARACLAKEGAQRTNEARLAAGAELAGLGFYEVGEDLQVTYADEIAARICGASPGATDTLAGPSARGRSRPCGRLVRRPQRGKTRGGGGRVPLPASAIRPTLAPPSGQGHGAGCRGTADPEAGRPARHLAAAGSG